MEGWRGKGERVAGLWEQRRESVGRLEETGGERGCEG